MYKAQWVSIWGFRMASRNLDQGKLSIQSQQLDEGKRLLRIALKNDSLTPAERVEAYTWLAETDPNPQFKIQQYQEAIRIDPSNQDVLYRLNYWTQQAQQAQQNPPQINPQQQEFQQGLTPSQGMQPINPQQQQFQQDLTASQQMQAVNPPQPVGYGQQAPIHLQQVQRTVGILGGANGTGTGFFVTRDGLVATTRHIVGGASSVSIQLLDGRQLTGTVVRSFPEIDLTLIQTNVQLAHLLGISQSPTIPDNIPIVAVTHSGNGIRSAKRRSAHESQDHWFPTLINRLEDAGGNPIFDERNALVGMLTKNASRSNGYMYGLHIYKIYQCVDQYMQEKAQLQGQNSIYCHSCGIISRAPSFGGHFCENCGITHPYALENTRFPQPNLSALYGENTQRPCPNCTSQVGFYDGACMRCGYEL